MASRKQPPRPESKVLTANDYRTGIKNLQRRIDDLNAFDVNTIEERWNPQTEALTKTINATLADIFGNGTLEYLQHHISSLDTLIIKYGYAPHIGEIRDGYRKGIKNAIVQFTSLKKRLEEKLEDCEEDQPQGQIVVPKSEATENRQVFIVHGQDEGAKQSVARFIGELDLDPIILHEQANQGWTIIEKIEAHADVGFAVVLLTPDDVGYRVGDEANKKPRARQNVILELGYFMGKIGRGHVCALYKEGVDIPSDYKGVAYISMDDSEGWKLKLAKEIKTSGISVDMNKVT